MAGNNGNAGVNGGLRTLGAVIAAVGLLATVIWKQGSDADRNLESAKTHLEQRVDSLDRLMAEHHALEGHPGILQKTATIETQFKEIETQFRELRGIMIERDTTQQGNSLRNRERIDWLEERLRKVEQRK